VLAALAARVVAIDDQADLVALARENLAALSVANATVIETPVAGGAPAEAPFDVIVVEGLVDAAPAALFGQLADGGRLVVLIRGGATAVANLFVKSGNDVAGRAEFNANLPALNAPAGDEFIF
jgi:protein-L-isoaspartate(D-aspartate) O-methyltransferase